jgi:hypothetical protein
MDLLRYQVQRWRIARSTGSNRLLTVVGESLCVRRPVEVKGKGIRRVGGVTGKEAYTVHTINFISQRQYFVARFHIYVYVCHDFLFFALPVT